MYNQIKISTIIILLICSCQNRKSKTISSINGTWKSIGSGWILKIKDSTSYQFYDITPISCLLNRKGDFKELEKSLTLKNDTLNLLKGVITYQFTKTQDLPELCMNNDEQNKKNPIYNFEVFAETVKEHYAFFEINDIKWDSLYNNQKKKLTENPTNIELYQVIEETLDLLNDNHAFLEATDEVYETLDSQLEPMEETESEKLPEYGDFQVAQMVAEHHMIEEMTKDSWLIQWGKMTENIGFIQVKAMWLFADLNIPKQLIDDVGYVDAYVQTFHKMYEGDYIQKEISGIAKQLDKIMKDLSEMESIVIDVRFNGGGQDAVSFEILSRFISKERLQIATQQLRNGNKLTNVLPLYIKGSENTYNKPVYVLTSQQTGSAAEAFSIATLAMDNTKRIGSKTSGAMSTALEKTLPNGWSFTISNEIYMDNNGKAYENIGIPVDYELSYPKDRQAFFRSVVDNLGLDKKNILKAISVLEKK
ncbi:S41 family peptidase [uncultured Tenacibaculum sp.]|uniref:S41 family peptidase n=1 Tax=uncultured Tenacibaculum sp. TaxID=174713 RepID=UPI0026380057|nr:S41 family peptidase [uncultured Tenacibaculum sp.]